VGTDKWTSLIYQCQLDYCNTLLAGTADAQTKPLQSVQNNAIRLVWCNSTATQRRHRANYSLSELFLRLPLAIPVFTARCYA